MIGIILGMLLIPVALVVVFSVFLVRRNQKPACPLSPLPPELPPRYVSGAIEKPLKH